MKLPPILTRLLLTDLEGRAAIFRDPGSSNACHVQALFSISECYFGW
jgi:hypothetical protein